MANVQALPREQLKQFEPLFGNVERSMGFVPNSLLTMARRPEILSAFTTLAGAVLGPGKLDPVLKQLVANIASTAAGCRYCQAHTAASAAHLGADGRKLRAVWEFETDSGFDASEKAALRFARDAAVVPNAVTPKHFADLRASFDDDQIVELTAVVSLFGWLNRWNDTIATELESEPLAFATENLGPSGWVPGKHAAER